MASRRTPDSSTRTSKPAAVPPTKAPKKSSEVKTASAGAAATAADVAKTATPSAGDAPSGGGVASSRAPAKGGAKPKATKSTATSAKMQVSEDTRRAMIAESAYLRAERRGFASGGEVEDWIAAEQEVNALLNANTGASSQ
jgi:hypothetical protein